MNLRALAVAAVAVLLCLGSAGAAAAEGVVVEEIGPGSALERAGLRPGDLLLAWEREGARGEIRTAFDWLWVKTEQSPRGAVRLRGERSGLAISFDVPKGLWDARMRPWMAADLLQTYLEGRRRIEAGDLEGGVALWDRLAQDRHLECWIRFEAGEALAKGAQGGKALDALKGALEKAEDAQSQVAIRERLGESYQYAGQIARAEESFRSALQVGETAWGESLQAAAAMARLGNVLRLRSRLDEARQLQERALEIRQRLAPDSLDVTDSLHHLALLALDAGDPEAMSEHTRRALAIHERWPPDTLELANSLSDLALLAMDEGRFSEAAATLQGALAILGQRSPGSIPLATGLGRLGLVARLLGEADSAVELLQRALAIRERLAPESLGTAALLSNLGMIARDRGDLAKAEEHFARALAISEKAVPNGIGVAGNLNALGTVARLRGDLDEAWDLHRRALEISERLPNRFDVATVLSSLGIVAEERGDLHLALDYHQRAHALYAVWAPTVIEKAETLWRLGRLHRRQGRLDQAAQLLAQAVDDLESKVEKLGGSQDLQAAYRARYDEIYREAIEVALERGRSAEAFHLVERSRARSFLTLLAERDLKLSGDLPAGLERSRRDNSARYDKILRDLARWTPAAGDEARDGLHRELGRLRQERDRIAADIRKASPRLAALRQPQPLGLEAARKVLDPGTLALFYSVGKNRTDLFALTREGDLRVKILPIGEERLRADVERFLESVRQPAAEQELPADLARSLFRDLVLPVADLVERSERVLILPDGALHRLPFGALIRDSGKRQFLTEWKPLHTALSLTVYGTLRAAEPEPAPAAPARLAAFGDPRFPKNLAPSREDRDPIRRPLGPALRRFNWEPLPHTRRELERIAEIYPGARLYLGEGATEEQAKAIGRGARVLHFATHGYTDDRTPLDSALVLTIPEELPAGRDNGLLQVWEILESVRLDADLVVLSACESALGRELNGEGMIGLTRAFQYAGARSVVASLWSVADQVTAELMARFHRHLAAGLTKDEALQAAQLELIREPVRITTAGGRALETDASAPFFWAAFQLFGDWR